MVPMLQPEIWLTSAWVAEVEPAGIQDVVPSPGNTRLERRGQRWMFIKGRLKEGETVERAGANLQVIMRQLAETYPKSNEKRTIAVARNVRVHPAADALLRPVAIALMGGIGLVLLVACANVANMLMARASGRQKEIGIRLAIGAGRARIVRQMLTESVVLALFGATAGVLVGKLMLWAVQALPLPLPVPLALSVRIDGRVLAFTAAVASLAGIIAGLAPALQATRPDVVAELKGEVSGRRTGRWRWSLGDGLVVAQTAVTLVLLVAAGLLTRSIMQAQHVKLGFDPDGLVAVAAEYSLIGYTDERATRVFEQVRGRVRSMPGVQSVSLTLRQPLAINQTRNSIFFPDRQRAGDEAVTINATSVDQDYFATLGVPLLQGRNFTAADTPTSARVAIVNAAFARTYFSGGSAVGRRFRLRGIDGPEYQIVGVVADYKVQTVGEPPTPCIHYSISRRAFTGQVVLARTSADANALVAAIRREFLAIEPDTVFFESQTMGAQVDATLLPARIAAQAIGIVGLVATLLAAIGLYGVVAYAVARRTREIGIRMALGARPSGVLGMVMRQGLGVTAVGLAVGSLLAWMAARGLSAGLYGVGAADPAAWAGAIAVLLGAAVLANYIPARRAARVDPSSGVEALTVPPPAAAGEVRRAVVAAGRPRAETSKSRLYHLTECLPQGSITAERPCSACVRVARSPGTTVEASDLSHLRRSADRARAGRG